MKKISIIIPIYNAEKFLPILFKCLNKCKFLNGDEVILIDNGSKDNSKQLCEEQVKKYNDLYKYYYYVKKSDSYSARNYGVDLAKGDIFVFTDSDCMPVPEWLSSIRDNIKHGEIMAGRIKIEISNNGLWEYFDSIAHLNSERNVYSNNVATANMAVYREDFFKNGKFEERFSGGDYEWSTRSKKNKLSIKFNPKALVYHPSRKNFQQILKKEQRIAYGSGLSHKIKNKNFYLLIIKYILKVFKIDTNIRYSIQLKKCNLNWFQIFIFNVKFFEIRFQQIKYVYYGFMNKDVRKLKLK